MAFHRCCSNVGLALLLLVGIAAPAAAETAALRARIEAFVLSRSASPPSRIDVPPLSDFGLPGVPAEQIEITLRANAAAPMTGSVPITVIEHVDGEEVKRGVVTVRVEGSRGVVVAARDLPRGARIGPDDLRTESRPDTKLPPGLVTDPDRVIGFRTTRSIRAGTIWQAGFAREGPVVARGEWVRLRLNRGALTIEATGKARDDGRVGDRVRVLNTDSRREVVGFVQSDGVVHVSF